jgi:hypothetical protein
VLQAGAGELPVPLRAALRDDIDTDRAVAALRRYSLVERHGDGLRAHRIVQAVIRQSLSSDEYNTWLAAAIRLLRPHFPDNLEEHPELWPMCARLSPHARVVEALAGTGTVEPVALAALLNGAGVYLWSRGEYELGASVLQQALARSERVLGPEHPHTAHRLHHLGWLLRDQGDLAAARPCLERATAIRERYSGRTTRPPRAASTTSPYCCGAPGNGRRPDDWPGGRWRPWRAGSVPTTTGPSRHAAPLDEM